MPWSGGPARSRPGRRHDRALLDLTELAARAEVPVDRLRHYAEAGLLPPARRDGDQLGYPTSEANTMRLLDTVARLGISADDLPPFARSWRDGGCGQAQQRLSGAVAARLDTVQDRLTEQQQLAVRHGPGTSGWVDATRATVPLAEAAARLQAVAAALPATAHAGPCDEDCGCLAALTAPGDRYQFPTAAAADGEPALAATWPPTTPGAGAGLPRVRRSGPMSSIRRRDRTG
jgi:DNA-binding transcriptional MerR regulator